MIISWQCETPNFISVPQTRLLPDVSYKLCRIVNINILSQPCYHIFWGAFWLSFGLGYKQFIVSLRKCLASLLHFPTNTDIGERLANVTDSGFKT